METHVRVRYAETDQMGVAYHANYLVWMEIGRVEYCRSHGLNYRDLELDEKLFLSVVEVSCRYLAPARYDDEVVIRTKIVSANPRMVRFSYELRDAGSGRKLATGETAHVFVNEQFRPRRLPDRYWDFFGIGE